MPYPLGIANIPMMSMIDVDESKIILEMVNRKHGKCLLERRCRESGLYGHFVAAIAPNGERWSDISDRKGTDTAHFYQFISGILNQIGHATPATRRCFIMDNLNVHKHPAVLGLIYHYGHRIVCRTPYCPFDGPIEYFFNTVEGNLRKNCYAIHNINDLVTDVTSTMALHVNFLCYFHHVGYR
jgi:DDE superfamily endonuclease